MLKTMLMMMMMMAMMTMMTMIMMMVVVVVVMIVIMMMVMMMRMTMMMMMMVMMMTMMMMMMVMLMMMLSGCGAPVGGQPRCPRVRAARGELRGGDPPRHPGHAHEQEVHARGGHVSADTCDDTCVNHDTCAGARGPRWRRWGGCCWPGPRAGRGSSLAVS